MKGRAVRQSSTHPNFQGVPELAVNGSSDARWASGSCTLTSLEANAWWEVNLGDIYSITKVRITNRAEYGERLNPFKVLVDGQECATKLSVVQGATLEIPCVATGRSVRVQLEKTDYLTICEFEVFGGIAQAPQPATCDNIALVAVARERRIDAYVPKALQEKIRSLQDRLDQNKRRLVGLRWVEAADTKCNALRNAVNKLYQDIKKFVLDNLCIIAGLAMDAAAWVVDKAILVANPVVGVKLADPVCIAGDGILSTAFHYAKKAISFLITLILCNIGKSGLFSNESMTALEKYANGTCQVATYSDMMYKFGVNVYCGNVAQAIMTILKPVVLCRLPWKPDGGMCRVDGCL